MEGPGKRDKAGLRFCRLPFDQDDADIGFAPLAVAVFGATPLPPWTIYALFDDQRCVAGLQVACLGLSCGSDVVPVTALRNVAVAADRRGRGLMRALLEKTLPLCHDHTDTVLLFAETAELYTRFGFVPVTQSAFEGPAPDPRGDGGAVEVDIARDATLLERLLATRAPVSDLCALTEDAGLAAHALASGDWSTVYHAGLDAVVVSERANDTLVVIDVVAPRMPSAAQILGALDVRPKRLKTLFPPDRLAWVGQPVPEDTGLMLRGTRPSAMRRPFMLPPTVDF